jgi:archaellum component FlaC
VSLCYPERFIQRLPRKIDSSLSIADMITQRDAVKQKLNALYKLSEGATIELNRYSRSEIVQKSSVSVPEIQKQINELSKAYREIDTKLQALNWNTDLL